jgi:hypothetical protein
MMGRKLLIAAVIAAPALFSLPVCAQDNAPVVISSPAAWTTLRSDSVTVSLQADTAALPKGSVSFKVLRRSGARSSVLFSKSVKVEDGAVDAFLGRVPGGLPVGGSDFLSIEWSVPGTELKGVVEPVGVVKLNGKVVEDNKWVPGSPRLAAVRLEEGITGDRAAEALGGLAGVGVGGGKIAAGWNDAKLFLSCTPLGSAAEAEFAFDLKCGYNAFLAWADRFVATDDDSAYGSHASMRSVDKDGLKVEESPWVGAAAPALVRAGKARMVSLDWSELGIQPFEGRAVGFAAFAKGKAGVSYPAGANRAIPGTWGGIELGK